MRRPVHVFYRARLNAEELRQEAEALGDVFFYLSDLASFELGKGIPGSWREAGAVFSGWAELRWRKRGDDAYEALLITDRGGAAPEGWHAVEGNWEGESREVLLQDLKEPRVRPSFGRYPHGETGGKLKATVYYRDEMAVFVSPREFEGEDG